MPDRVIIDRSNVPCKYTFVQHNMSSTVFNIRTHHTTTVTGPQSTMGNTEGEALVS